jgi:hypothetical protein
MGTRTDTTSDFRARWDAMKATGRLATEQVDEGWETHPDHLYAPTFVDLGAGQFVKRTPICATPDAVYSAWELQPEGEPFSHSTTTRIGGRRCGRIGSRSLPPDLAAMRPLSGERYDAVEAWLEAQREESRALIRRAFPGREFRQPPGTGNLETPLA